MQPYSAKIGSSWRTQFFSFLEIELAIYKIGGDDHGRFLGPFGDDLEQELGADLGQRYVSHLIERDQIVTGPT